MKFIEFWIRISRNFGFEDLFNSGLRIWQISVKFAAKHHRFGEKTAAFAKKLATSLRNTKIDENFEIRERCKGVHCVDLGESFPTSIFLQNLTPTQPRTSPVKFERATAGVALRLPEPSAGPHDAGPLRPPPEPHAGPLRPASGRARSAGGTAGLEALRGFVPPHGWLL